MSHRDSFSDGRLNLECRSKAVVLYRTLVQTSNKNCYGQQKSIGSSRVDGTLGPTGHLIVFVSISERGSIRKRGVDQKSLEKRTFQELGAIALPVPDGKSLALLSVLITGKRFWINDSRGGGGLGQADLRCRESLLDIRRWPAGHCPSCFENSATASLGEGYR